MANVGDARRRVGGLGIAACGLGLAVACGGALAQERVDRGGRYLYRTLGPDGVYRELQPSSAHSVARQWTEAMLEAIRDDKARPTVHARNLYHVSAAMYDAWAAYDDVADQLFHQERIAGARDLQAAREEAISFAAYRVLRHRFASSVGAGESLPAFDALMDSLGYDRTNTSVAGDSPAALGNRVAASVIGANAADGANEANDYANLSYMPINPPLFPDFPGNPDVIDVNRWQPLAIQFFVDQSGVPIPLGSLEFLSPEWGAVTPFALKESDATNESRGGFNYKVYHDPGAPPYLNGEGDEYYRWGTEMVLVWAAHLDPSDGVEVDISPNNFGNSPLPENDAWASYYDFFDGGDSGIGRAMNPVTGMPYPEQEVPRGDYARILAEFWADGPDSETPPGHWFTLLNYVNDHPSFVKRFGGTGPVLDDLEWDVKSYLVMGSGMHDSAITAWGCKGRYDYVRPITAIRYQCEQGQSSDMNLPSYSSDGVRLIDGYIELIRDPKDPLFNPEHMEIAVAKNAPITDFVGMIAVKSWRGPDFIMDEDVDEAGVGWILGIEWWPYQRPSFVTPPFAGYVSGHSTYSRAAAELMTMLTGDEYFPGGVGEFFCPQEQFLVFEDGPSEDITLQWATYRDASDQTSLSRIWGGIHPPADDLPGRRMGFAVSEDSFALAVKLFNGQLTCPADLSSDGAMMEGDAGFGSPDDVVTMADFMAFASYFQDGNSRADFTDASAANPLIDGFMRPDGVISPADFSAFVIAYVQGCK